jgi:hypothetical protein
MDEDVILCIFRGNTNMLQLYSFIYILAFFMLLLLIFSVLAGVLLIWGRIEYIEYNVDQ